MGSFPPPQYDTPLDTSEIKPELPFYPIYGVTPDDKYIPISIDGNGRLNVNATFSGSITIGEIGAIDESSFTYGTSLQQAIGGVYQDTNPTLSAGEQGAVRLTEYRAFHTNLRDSNGNEVGTFSSPLRIDPTGTTIQPISGSVSVSNPSIAVTQSGPWTVSLTSESIEIGTVDQGTPNTLANAWPVKMTDGTNVLGTGANPVRTDPTGTTTQPVSAASLPLPTNAAQETGGNLASINSGIQTLNSLVPSEYDYISLSYSGNNLSQAKFYLGGPFGTLISTLTLLYTGNNLTSVQRS